MWILPSQLHTSDFVPDTEALNLGLNESSQICAQSLFVRSKPTPARTWLLKWKRDSWSQHLFGRILKPSLGNHFVTAWTSLLEATHANPSAQQERGSEQKTQDIFGLTSQAEFGFLDLSSASSRMSKDTSVSDSEKSLENWNKWVTRCRGEYSVRRSMRVRLTSAKEYLSWPTISVNESKNSVGKSQLSRNSIPLGTMAMIIAEGHASFVATNSTTNCLENTDAQTARVKDAANWSTPESHPRTHTPRNVGAGTYRGKEPLANQVAELHGLPALAKPSMDGNRPESWRTPSSSDGEGGVMQMREGCAGKYKLRDHAANGNKSAKLNPRWVETLQGVCMGWTSPSCPASVIRNWPKFVSGWSKLTIELMNSDSSETELSQQQQNEPLEF